MTAAKSTKRAAVDPRSSSATNIAPRATKAAKPAADKAAPEAAAEKAEPIGRRPTAAEKRQNELVSVTVPVPFKFTCPDHSMIDYPSGIYDMPRCHAEDSFAQGMGVTLND